MDYPYLYSPTHVQITAHFTKLLDNIWGANNSEIARQFFYRLQIGWWLPPNHKSFIMNELIQEEYLRLYNEELAKLLICPSCLNTFKSLTQLTKCGHGFCEPCIKTYLKSKVDQGCRRIEEFQCMADGCPDVVAEIELERWMEFEYFNKLTNKVAFELHFLCPGCRQRSEFKSTEQLKCPNCNMEFCKFCKAAEHEGRCNTSTIYWKEVRAAVDDEEVGYCPECRTPFMKDENCDHVTCQNTECNREFCFYCWVPFDSVNWHGGMFHRSDCRNFEDYGEDVNYYHECPACLKASEGADQQICCSKPTETRAEMLERLGQELFI